MLEIFLICLKIGISFSLCMAMGTALEMMGFHFGGPGED